jgi:hypothetical protein
MSLMPPPKNSGAICAIFMSSCQRHSCGSVGVDLCTLTNSLRGPLYAQFKIDNVLFSGLLPSASENSVSGASRLFIIAPSPPAPRPRGLVVTYSGPRFGGVNCFQTSNLLVSPRRCRTRLSAVSRCLWLCYNFASRDWRAKCPATRESVGSLGSRESLQFGKVAEFRRKRGGRIRTWQRQDLAKTRGPGGYVRSRVRIRACTLCVSVELRLHLKMARVAREEPR